MDVINKDKFIENYISGIPQIIQKELIADIETPISSLLKISDNEKYSFLLESVEGGDQRGRFSLLGCDPDLIWEVKNNKVEITSLNNNIDLSISDYTGRTIYDIAASSRDKRILKLLN